MRVLFGSPRLLYVGRTLQETWLELTPYERKLRGMADDLQ
jgi:hypothetical protein